MFIFFSYIYLFFIQMDEHIIIKSSKKCPMCRRKYKKPHAEAQAADANLMIRIAGERFRRYSIHIESGLFCYPLFPLFFH